MRLRTPESDRARSASETEPTADASSGKRLAKHLLSAAGVLAFTYVVLRVFGPRDDVPVQSVDEVRARAAEAAPDGVRERAEDALPDGVRERAENAVPDEIRSRAADAAPGTLAQPVAEIRDRAGEAVPDDAAEIPIGEPGDDESETDAEGDTEASGDAEESSGDAIDETATNAEYTDERSDEEIAERAESNVQDEPAEPGEMTVDEDVADDLVDTDTDAEVGSDRQSTDDSDE